MHYYRQPLPSLLKYSMVVRIDAQLHRCRKCKSALETDLLNRGPRTIFFERGFFVDFVDKELMQLN